MLLGITKADRQPYPIMLPGEKTLNSTRVGEFVNEELFYYAEFYANFKHSGSPFVGGWAEWPTWCLQVIRAFDFAVDEVRAWNERKEIQRMRRK